MTLLEWQSLRKGDVIFSKSNKAREVLENSKNNCIRLKPLRKLKYDNNYTVYTKSEAKNFKNRKYVLDKVS